MNADKRYSHIGNLKILKINIICVNRTVCSHVIFSPISLCKFYIRHNRYKIHNTLKIVISGSSIACCVNYIF